MSAFSLCTWRDLVQNDAPDLILKCVMNAQILFVGFQIAQLCHSEESSTAELRDGLRKNFVGTDQGQSHFGNIWGFPEIGVPPVIIHFQMGFSLKYTIQLGTSHGH